MAIYRTGQASMDAQGYITGYDTKWREQLTLIRPGATIVFLTQPLQIAVITEVINDTSIRAITTGGAVVARSNYAILLHDSITVDGLAQDVAETLRYYQSKESEIGEALEFFKTFDWKHYQDLAKQVEENAASANQSKDAAARSASDALTSKNAAKASEDKAKEYADSINPANMLNKNNNLSDVADKGEARKNLSVDRFVQETTSTVMTVGDYKFSLANNGEWGVTKNNTPGWIPLGIDQGGTGYQSTEEYAKNQKLAWAEYGDSDWSDLNSTKYYRFFTGSTNGASSLVTFGINIPHVGSPDNYVFQLSARNSSFYARTMESGAWSAWAGLTTYAISDETMKNIKGNLNIEGALDNINRMDFKIFSYLSDGPERSYRRGVISQQIRKIDREYTKEIGGILHLDQTPMLLDGLAAIKALRSRDVDNKEKIAKLEKEVEELKAAVSALINKQTTLES
ncbi:tail fiber protein [Escherichia phage grams]|uniref:Peptidase S74 domain-containing protein n=1 Tax=Escherichia phage grams TaxID=2696401 RepID=A0A6B9WKN6_9CAUD|nr:tail fiber protein [Escherichia phage grams]QHR65252.1 hypothetical protein grams_61 [Escherichia phage grams]